MRDLVFVKFNSKLRNKRQKKDRDPLEKEVDDVVADGDNEFITGIMPLPSEMEQQCAQESQQHTPQQAEAEAQTQAKRKRPVRPKKRKVRSRLRGGHNFCPLRLMLMIYRGRSFLFTVAGIK